MNYAAAVGFVEPLTEDARPSRELDELVTAVLEHSSLVMPCPYSADLLYAFRLRDLLALEGLVTSLNHNPESGIWHVTASRLDGMNVVWQASGWSDHGPAPALVLGFLNASKQLAKEHGQEATNSGLAPALAGPGRDTGGAE